jgi:hypothetical protein
MRTPEDGPPLQNAGNGRYTTGHDGASYSSTGEDGLVFFHHHYTVLDVVPPRFGAIGASHPATARDHGSFYGRLRERETNSLDWMRMRAATEADVIRGMCRSHPKPDNATDFAFVNGTMSTC